MHAAPDVKPTNEAYPNFHNPPIWSEAASLALSLPLSNAETPLCEITVQF